MRFGSEGSSRVINLVALSLSAALGGLPAFAVETHRFDIPEESASAAIRDFGAQAHVQVLVASEFVRNKKLRAVSGNLSTEEALDRMLEGSGLTHKYVGDGSIALIPLSQASDQPPASGNAEPGGPGKGGRDSSGTFLLAQAAQGASTGAASADERNQQASKERRAELQEVIVTAQKRAEREQDVPVAMTVLDPQTLAENGQNRLMDYFATVPGLSLFANTFTGGTQYVTIRGLSTGTFQNSTVATVIDDVPIGSSLAIVQGNLLAPDLDPSDLERIEVLKGPQGTLYGADSLGGLVRYVTKDPSVSAFSGHVEVGGVDIPDGAIGYTMRAAVNMPVSSTFAIRAAAFSRLDPGYVDDLTTEKNNINSADVYGGHLSALFLPSDDLSIKLSALLQNTDGHGTGFINSNSMEQFVQGDLKQTGLPGTGAYETRWQLYTATVNAKLAGLDIVSVTGYNVNTLHSYYDLSGSAFYNFVAGQFFPGAGYVGTADLRTEKFSQELRLSSSVQQWLDWTAGAFYTHESSPGSQQGGVADNPATGSEVGLLATFNYSPLTLSESAIFADLTFHVTDQFDLQLGGREARDRLFYEPVYVGPAIRIFNGVPIYAPPPARANGNPFTYLVTPKYSISPDLQVYARVASGYRVGGPNSAAGVGLGGNIPTEYQPDRTTDYEVGIKADAFDHMLSFDAAAYYIDWKNFQISVYEDTISFVTNASAAKSEGVEMSVTARPRQGLTLAAQSSYNNAVLTQDLPPGAINAGAYGVAGDRLPYSIRFSGGITANQDIRLSSDWVGFIGGAATAVSSRPQGFAGGPSPQVRLSVPGYAQLNVHTGARSESWLLNLYVNNLTDKRGVIGLTGSAAAGDAGGYGATVIQPRTIGLSVGKTF